MTPRLLCLLLIALVSVQVDAQTLHLCIGEKREGCYGANKFVRKTRDMPWPDTLVVAREMCNGAQPVIEKEWNERGNCCGYHHYNVRCGGTSSTGPAPVDSGPLRWSARLNGSAFLLVATNPSRQAKSCSASYTLDYMEFGEQKSQSFNVPFQVASNSTVTAVNHQTQWAGSGLRYRDVDVSCD